MTANLSLEELIRNKEIEFFSYGRKLDTIDDFGEYNTNLIRRLLRHSGDKINVKGNGLGTYLTVTKNLYLLTEFLVQIGRQGAYKNIVTHVDVDITLFDRFYPQPKELKIVNFLGKTVDNPALWVPEMPYFEKMWNFALCRANIESGYDYPGTEESFRYRIAKNAETSMIGTPEQIKRYQKYALENLHKAAGFFDMLNPIGTETEKIELICRHPSPLRALEENANSARIIAENITIFSGEYSQ